MQMALWTWTKSDTSRFIELYKSHPHLWNKNSDLYNNRTARALAYHSIIDSIKNDAIKSKYDVKKQIKNIKSNYNREKKRIAQAEKDGENYVPVLWYASFKEIMDLKMAEYDVKQKNTRLKWIRATGRQNWEPPKTVEICSEHFKKEDFFMHGNRYLVDGAVPTLHVFSEDKEIISDSDDDEEPSTSTDCQTKPKDVNQGNSPDDDDDIICVEPSPTKPNPAKAQDKTLAVEKNAAPKRKKIKLTQSNDNNIGQKLEVPNDEFQMFANNIAAQLRTLPLDVALNLQTEMHKLVAKERSERYRMSQQVNSDKVVVKVDNDN